jgi:hypothetical protein
MKKKIILSIVFIIVLFYPGLLIFKLEQTFNNGSSLRQIENAHRGYQISIWLTWIVMVSLSVYYKWISEKNLFFSLTFLFLFVSISLFGFYVHRMVNTFEIDTGFRDPYTFGFLTALQNFVVAAILTGLLQAGVWWFTRKWHRR